MSFETIYEKAVWESDPAFEREYDLPDNSNTLEENRVVRKIVPWVDDKLFEELSDSPDEDYDEDYI